MWSALVWVTQFETLFIPADRTEGPRGVSRISDGEEYGGNIWNRLNLKMYMKDKNLTICLVPSISEGKIDYGKIINDWDLNLERKNFHFFQGRFYFHQNRNCYVECGKREVAEQSLWAAMALILTVVSTFYHVGSITSPIWLMCQPDIKDAHRFTSSKL